MVKVLKYTLLTVLVLPYLFLFTSVEQVKGTELDVDCTFSKIQTENHLVSFGSVFYSLFESFGENKRIILPYFGNRGEYVYLNCGGDIVPFASTKLFQPGELEQIESFNVRTEVSKISLFGIELFNERGIYGVSWRTKGKQ